MGFAVLKKGFSQNVFPFLGAELLRLRKGCVCTFPVTFQRMDQETLMRSILSMVAKLFRNDQGNHHFEKALRPCLKWISRASLWSLWGGQRRLVQLCWNDDLLMDTPQFSGTVRSYLPLTADPRNNERGKSSLAVFLGGRLICSLMLGTSAFRTCSKSRCYAWCSHWRGSCLVKLFPGLQLQNVTFAAVFLNTEVPLQWNAKSFQRQILSWTKNRKTSVELDFHWNISILCAVTL